LKSSWQTKLVTMTHTSNKLPRRTALYNRTQSFGTQALNTTEYINITFWTVVQTVLTATFNSYGDRQISTTQKINTPEPINKKFGIIDYVREGTSCTKFNFRKMSITSDWIKISAPNVTGRCITAMRKWPRDQKSKPEVNSRDVMNFWSINVSISVTITYIWTKFGTEHKYHTISTPEWPNSHKMKIQDGGCRHLEFRKNVNNSGLNKGTCTKFCGKMHHGYAEMITWPEVETGS